MKVTILILGLAISIASCATGGKKKSGSSLSSSSSSSSKEKRSRAPDNRREISVTGSVKPFTNSLSNSPASSKRVDKGKARSLASKLERQVKVSKKVEAMDVLALMAAKRLAGENSRSVIGSAKRLVGQEMRKDINRKLPDIGQLEIALASFQSGQYGMAEYYIIQLLESKSPPIRSAALNLNGLMKYKFSTLRNATDLWEAALKADASNQAARLNLALVALSYADFKTAKRLLAATEQDWFVMGNQAVAEKLALNGKQAQGLCNNALRKESKNRSLLFNCAVADFQVANDYKGAMDKLQKANSMSGGGADLSDKIVKAIRIVKGKMAQAAAPKKDANKKK
jgi:hypothetical protein